MWFLPLKKNWSRKNYVLGVLPASKRLLGTLLWLDPAPGLGSVLEFPVDEQTACLAAYSHDSITSVSFFPFSTAQCFISHLHHTVWMASFLMLQGRQSLLVLEIFLSVFFYLFLDSVISFMLRSCNSVQESPEVVFESVVHTLELSLFPISTSQNKPQTSEAVCKVLNSPLLSPPFDPL